MAFHLYRSNRTERLVDALAAVVSRALDDPFAADCIVVQGKGMERWLSMQLASRLGVWANPSFPFPRKLIGDAMERVLGPADARAEAFEPEALLWSVARLLPELCPLRPFAPLRHYLEEDERGVKRLQLASRIATVFDHYVVYRPDLIRHWQRGAEEDAWQAILWRRLVELHGDHHFATRAGRLFTALREGASLAPPFPTRVALFGLSTLPPLYVDLLHALSASVDVHLFLLSPSREYGGTIRDRASTLREALRRDGHLPSEAELEQIEGHPLLASLGRLGREFQEVLESAVDYVEADDDLYESPAPATMLGAVQADILHLRQRGGGASAAALPVRDDDSSIRVHSCHGPMREIEVLHDQLLALFDTHPTLEPRDVIVMTPAIDAYAPYIDAVFRPGDDLRGRIPYRIADRSARSTEEVSDAFFRLLDVLGGRLGASEVLDLLGIDAIRIRARLSADDLDLVRDWIAGSGIRWGADAADREQMGQPPLAENTWRFGLDRLLLGYALAGDGRRLPFGVLPYDDVEGGEAAALGRLAELAQVLFDYRSRLRAPRTLAAWSGDLEALLGAVIANTNLNAFQHQRLREALAALARRAESAGFSDEVNLEVVREQLEDEIRTGSSSRGFLSGGVTFCELVPMRTIPFRVVCLVGMNDGAFPRQRRPLGFDRIAAEPRAGDRSVREDDRYLFLEALLSARETLQITYVGQSITDNSELPPSVVVSELLDCLDRGFAPAGDAPARSRVVVRHPLQPFSPRNFGDGLFSYSRPHFEGARALEAAARADHPASPPFIASPLPALDAAPRQITVDQLVRFFEHPTRAFLQSRLGVYLGRDLEAPEDREPLYLNNLEEWEIGDRLLRLCESAEDVAAAIDRERARGALPPGELGVAAFEKIALAARDVLRTAAPLRLGDRRSAEVDVTIGDTRITGVLRDLWPAGQLRLQYSRLGKRHELGFWLRHLLLQFCAPEGVARQSYLLGRPEKKGEDAPPAMRFRTVEESEPTLRYLLDLYWLGQRWPLPLFEGASRAYVSRLIRAKKNPEEQALGAAIKAFTAGERPFGEDNTDVHVCQVYGADVSFDDMRRFQSQHQAMVPGFEELARRVYLPLLEHRERWT